MNRWRIAFWCCLACLVLVVFASAYVMLDQAVTLTYHHVSYEDVEEDLDQMIDLVNDPDRTKSHIENRLKTEEYYQYMDFNDDTIVLRRVLLIFDHDSLVRVTKQW